MEHCTWLHSHRDPPGEGGRVYLGDEGCPRFLAGETFAAAANRLLGKGRAVTLVTPILTPRWVAPFERLLRAVTVPVEIVCNDAGALTLTGQTKHTAVVGRLLSRQCTDPAVAGFRKSVPDRAVAAWDGPALLRHQPPPDSLWERWQTPPVFSPGTLAAYRAAVGGPLRVEVDLPPQGLPDTGPDCAVTVHVSETLVAVRACGDCETCPAEAVSMGKTRAGVEILRRRNTIFYRGQIPDIPVWCDRVVSCAELAG